MWFCRAAGCPCPRSAELGRQTGVTVRAPVAIALSSSVDCDDERRLAVVALYRAHYGELYRLALLLTHDVAAAEDLTHDAFVRVYARWHAVEDQSRGAAYLRATLVNLARSRWRRQRVADRRRPTNAMAAPSAEDSALGKLGVGMPALSLALDALSPRQRACIVLRHYLQMTEGEIAETVGLSVGSVRTHLKRATAALSSSLGGIR